MSGVELITQAEYARRRGVAKSAVARAVAERRITLIDGKVDPVVADVQWEHNTRARADGGRSTTTPAPGAVPPALPTSEPVAPTAGDGGYSANRARREQYEADMAQMKMLEQQGDLVRVAEVRAEMAKRIGQVRTNMLQIPARLAPLLAAESDQAVVYAMLDAELRSALGAAATSD